MGSRREFTQEQVDAMVKRYKDRESLRNIAKTYSVSVPTVRKCISGAGVEIRSVGRPRKDQVIGTTSDTTESGSENTSNPLTPLREIKSW